MSNFDLNLMPTILSDLSIKEIMRICSVLTTSQYQNICKNQKLWRDLIYRDYGTFTPIISTLEKEKVLSYFNLYR